MLSANITQHTRTIFRYINKCSLMDLTVYYCFTNLGGMQIEKEETMIMFVFLIRIFQY